MTSRSRVRTWCLAGLLLGAAISSAPLAVQPSPDFASLQARWLAGGDASLLSDLERFWRTAPGGRRWEIAFMAAVTRCAIGGPEDIALARMVLDSLPARYGANGETRDRLRALAAAARDCSPAAAAPTASSVRAVHVRYRTVSTSPVVAGIAYSNKLFADACPAAGAGGQLAVKRQPVSASIPAFAYALAESSTARPWARAELRTAFHAEPRGLRAGRFLIITLGAQPEALLRAIGDGLERARRFHERTFGLRTGDSLITVYLVPDQQSFGVVARALHGIPPRSELIGYSVDQDQSIVAIIPRGIYGTLQHELMHLLVRRNFPDAPWWLNEGLAALYEVAEFRDSAFVGLPNWRGRFLSLSGRPSLAELFRRTSGSDVRDAYGGDFFRQTIADAEARYFVLYLQQRSLLAPVVAALQSAPLFSGDDTGVSPDTTPVSVIVRAARGRATLDELRALEDDFGAWLKPVLQGQGFGAGCG